MAEQGYNDVLQQYLNSIQHYQQLEFEEEQKLARKWRDEKDYAAADKLMKAHLRLVVKVAIGFKGYGLPMSEVIQEGNIGLMQAITRFNPDMGYRLSTYAMWWIRASIQEYVLTSWSLVKIGTTAAQKKLFFNLRKLRARLRDISEEDISEEAVKFIADELDVKEEEVKAMNQRMMANDQSLNSMVSEEGGNEWMDFLVEERPNQEETYSNNQIMRQRRIALQEAMEVLDDRERYIFEARRLTYREQTPTLEELSEHFGISRERVRQLEVRAYEKVKKRMSSVHNALPAV